MDSFNSIGEAIDAIVILDREKFGALPEPVQTVMTAMAGVGASPVDRIVKTGEVIYANRDDITDKDTLLLAGKLVEYGSTNGWHGLNVDDRADKLQRALKVKAKVKGVTIAAKDIPDALPEFQAEPQPDEAEDPPAAPEPSAPAED